MFDVWKMMFPNFFLLSYILMCFPLFVCVPNANDYDYKFRTPRQMKAQANTTREQCNNKNIYDIGWRPSHGENGGVGKKNLKLKKLKQVSSVIGYKSLNLLLLQFSLGIYSA